MLFKNPNKIIATLCLLFLVTACGGGGGSGSSGSGNGNSGSGNGGGSGNNSNGTPPVAATLSIQNASSSSSVTLDASPSFDLDGSISGYSWSQTSGTAVTLNNTNSMITGFTAPAVTVTTELRFSLTVTDNDNDSDSITVSILIKPPVEDFTSLTGPVVLGALETLDIAQNIAVRGDYAYVADWESGLKIIDISNPRSPQIAAVLDTGSRAWDIAFSTDGETVFVGDQDSLYAVNITDPDNPYIVDQTFGSDLGATAIYISGNRLYAASYDSMYVMDVTDPSDMLFLGRYEFSTGIYPSNDLEVVEGIAYLARYSNGLLILDAQDPETITRLGGLDSENWAERLFIQENLVFMTDQDAGTKAIDVSNPALPQLSATIPVHEGIKGNGPTEAHSVKIIDDIAYIGTHFGTFQVWDINNLSNPVFMGEVQTVTQSTSLDVSGSLAYIVGHSGFNIIDVSAPISLQSQADFIRTVSSVSGSSLIIDGQSVYDVSDPTDPVVANLSVISGWNVTFSSTVYSINNGNASANGSLSIYDFSDVNNPVISGPGTLPQLSQLPANLFYYSSQLEGNTLFTSYRTGEFQLIDTSNPLSLVTRQLDLSDYGYQDVWGFNGDYVYAVQDTDLAIVDISDLANPVEVGDIEYSGRRIMVEDDYVYMTGMFDFRVYDMSNPAAPRLAVVIPTQISNEISRVDDLLFIGLGQSGSGMVMVVDVSQPEFPAYTHLESGGRTVSGTLSNSDVMITQSYDINAIRIFDITPYFE